MEKRAFQHTTLNDLAEIFSFFEQSVLYQEKHGFPVWRNYDKNAVIRDVENLNHYKLVLDNAIAIVFSVCYADKIIWRTFDEGKSLYLHRIVVNPAMKGQKLFGRILDWAIDRARATGLQTIRMDTWAANPAIIDYYKGFGFEFIENYTTPDTDDLPAHNRNLALALLEFKLK